MTKTIAPHSDPEIEAMLARVRAALPDAVVETSDCDMSMGVANRSTRKGVFGKAGVGFKIRNESDVDALIERAQLLFA